MRVPPPSALGDDRAAVRLRDLLHDREAEPGAGQSAALAAR